MNILDPLISWVIALAGAPVAVNAPVRKVLNFSSDFGVEPNTTTNQVDVTLVGGGGARGPYTTAAADTSTTDALANTLMICDPGGGAITMAMPDPAPIGTWVMFYVPNNPADGNVEMTWEEGSYGVATDSSGNGIFVELINIAINTWKARKVPYVA